MNQFKKRYQVENNEMLPFRRLFKDLLKDNEIEQKEETKKTLTKEEEQNNMINLVFSFYRGELTEEKKQKLLAIDEKMMPNTKCSILLSSAKKYIEEGKSSEKGKEEEKNEREV